MKKIFLLIFLFAFGFAKAYAQPTATQKDVVDKKANEILQNAATKIKGYSSLELGLSIVADSKQEKTSEKTKATILMQADKYRLTMDDQIIYCNGKTIWFYLPDVKEVQIHNVNPESADAMNLSKLLLDYNKNYKARYIKDDQVNNVSVQIIDLFPRKSQDYSKLRLYLNKANSQITQMDMQQVSGKMSSYKVTSYKPNAPAAASDFEFSVYANPNVELIDMR